MATVVGGRMGRGGWGGGQNERQTMGGAVWPQANVHTLSVCVWLKASHLILHPPRHP